MAKTEKTECRSLYHQRITKEIHMFLQVKSTYHNSAFYVMALKQHTHAGCFINKFFYKHHKNTKKL